MSLLRRLGIAIGCAIALVLPIGVTAGNRIEFGPPGPQHTVAFGDGIVVASTTFRISHDRQHDGGRPAYRRRSRAGRSRFARSVFAADTLSQRSCRSRRIASY
jgi:hypothetical protein